MHMSHVFVTHVRTSYVSQKNLYLWLVWEQWRPGTVWLKSEYRVESCFQFSLIGYFCRCWLISLTSVVNWNIISIVFLCSMKLCACAACFGHCSALHLHWIFTQCVDENQYISIKKENWCSNQMQEEKSWSREKNRRGLTLCKRPTWLRDLRFYMRRRHTWMWVIDSDIVFDPPKLHATLLSIIHQVLSSCNIQPKDEKHCFRWWIVLLVLYFVFVFRKRFYFFTFGVPFKIENKKRPFEPRRIEELPFLFVLIEKFIVKINGEFGSIDSTIDKLLIFVRVASCFMHNIV